MFAHQRHVSRISHEASSAMLALGQVEDVERDPESSMREASVVRKRRLAPFGKTTLTLWWVHIRFCHKSNCSCGARVLPPYIGCDRFGRPTAHYSTEHQKAAASPAIGSRSRSIEVHCKPLRMQKMEWQRFWNRERLNLNNGAAIMGSFKPLTMTGLEGC
jgi:hypothetical protein